MPVLAIAYLSAGNIKDYKGVWICIKILPLHVKSGRQGDEEAVIGKNRGGKILFLSPML